MSGFVDSFTGDILPTGIVTINARLWNGHRALNADVASNKCTVLGGAVPTSNQSMSLKEGYVALARTDDFQGVMPSVFMNSSYIPISPNFKDEASIYEELNRKVRIMGIIENDVPFINGERGADVPVSVTGVRQVKNTSGMFVPKGAYVLARPNRIAVRRLAMSHNKRTYNYNFDMNNNIKTDFIPYDLVPMIPGNVDSTSLNGLFDFGPIFTNNRVSQDFARVLIFFQLIKSVFDANNGTITTMDITNSMRDATVNCSDAVLDEYTHIIRHLGRVWQQLNPDDRSKMSAEIGMLLMPLSQANINQVERAVVGTTLTSAKSGENFTLAIKLSHVGNILDLFK